MWGASKNLKSPEALTTTGDGGGVPWRTQERPAVTAVPATAVGGERACVIVIEDTARVCGSDREYVSRVEVLVVDWARRRREERQGWARRVQVHIGEGVPEQCAHSMRSRYDYRKPSRNYFLYIENARGPLLPLFPRKLPPLTLRHPRLFVPLPPPPRLCAS